MKIAELIEKIAKLRKEGNYKELIKFCSEVIIKGKEEEDYDKVIAGYLNRGVSYYYVGDIENAFLDLIKHRKLIEVDGKPADFLNSVNFFFVLYLHNKDYENCKKTLDQSIKLAKELGHLHIVSNGYSNYSHILNLEKNYKKALEMAAFGVEFAEAFEPYSELLIIRVKLNYIKSLIFLENFDESKKELDTLETFKAFSQNKRELASFYDLKAFFYLKQERFNKARIFYDKAIELVESYEDLNLLEDMYQSQIRTCDQLKDYEGKSNYQEKYIKVLNSIKKSELDKLSLSLEIQHQVAEQKKEIEYVKERNRILKDKNTLIEGQSKKLEELYNELWKVYDKTHKISQKDYLTGVYNRKYIEEYIHDVVFKNESLRISVSCLIFDIDNFKKVNDTYGHLIGDEIIKNTCEQCINLLGEEHKISRYGGDEFIIVLNDTTIDQATKIASTILDKVEGSKVYLNNNETVNVTLSIGISNNKVHEPKDVKEMIYFADLGLYNAKRNGRNQYSVYTESIS